MNRYSIIYLITFFVFFNSIAFGQDTTIVGTDTTITITLYDFTAPDSEKKEIALSETGKILCARWDLSEYKENGRTDELPNFELEFFPDGTYNMLEEQDYMEGTWIMSEDNSKIIFDEGTEYSDEWTIVNVDAKMFKVKFTSEGKRYEYTFVPYVEWKP